VPAAHHVLWEKIEFSTISFVVWNSWWNELAASSKNNGPEHSNQKLQLSSMQDILIYAIPNSGCLFRNDSHHPFLTLVSVPRFCVTIASIRAMTCLRVRCSQWRHILLVNHLSFFLNALHLIMLMHEPHTSGTRAVSICYIAVKFGHEIICIYFDIRPILLQI